MPCHLACRATCRVACRATCRVACRAARHAAPRVVGGATRRRVARATDLRERCGRIHRNPIGGIGRTHTCHLCHSTLNSSSGVAAIRFTTAGARQVRDGTTSAPGLGPPLPHLRRDWAHPCHICAGTGPAPATSAPGLGPPLPPEGLRAPGLRWIGHEALHGGCHVPRAARGTRYMHACMPPPAIRCSPARALRLLRLQCGARSARSAKIEPACAGGSSSSTQPDATISSRLRSSSAKWL